MSRLSLVALVVCLFVACVSARSANKQQQQRQQLSADQQDALELAEFVHDMEHYGRTGAMRTGRQMPAVTDAFGTMADISQVAGLMLRLAQALLSAVRYVSDMVTYSGRQNADALIEMAAAFSQVGSQAAVSLVRSYSPNLGQVLQNFLVSYDLMA